MKHLFMSLIVLLWLTACENAISSSSSSHTDETGAVFVSEVVEGKHTVDHSTAEELKGMKNTIENFTQLNKQKYENLPAYQEYGLLLQNHIERITTYCRLDADTKNKLCQNLDSIKQQMKTLEGEDMVKSREAIHHIHRLFSEIDSSFHYNN